MGNKDTADTFGTIGTQLGNTAGIVDKVGNAAKSTTPGILSAFGNMITGVGKIAGGDYAQGGLEVGAGFFDAAAVGSESKVLGPAGAALRGASAGYTMYENWDQCSADAPMAGNDCYTAMGDMMFAGAEVGAPVLGTAAKFGLDGLGMLAGSIDEDWAFSSGSVAGGAMHGGARAASAAADASSDLAHWLVGGPSAEFSPTGVPMTVAPPTDYEAPDRQTELEAIEAEWATMYGPSPFAQ